MPVNSFIMNIFHILVAFLIFAHCIASELSKGHILKYDFDNTGTGPYHYSFETSDGTSRQEVGELKYAGTDYQYIKVTGSFAHLGPDNVRYEVTYTADDQGFHPEGDHIKVPPFVPWIHHHHHHDHNEGTESPKYVSNAYTCTECLPSAAAFKPTVPSTSYNMETDYNFLSTPIREPELSVHSTPEPLPALDYRIPKASTNFPTSKGPISKLYIPSLASTKPKI